MVQALKLLLYFYPRQASFEIICHSSISLLTKTLTKTLRKKANDVSSLLSSNNDKWRGDTILQCILYIPRSHLVLRINCTVLASVLFGKKILFKYKFWRTSIMESTDIVFAYAIQRETRENITLAIVALFHLKWFSTNYLPVKVKIDATVASCRLIIKLRHITCCQMSLLGPKNASSWKIGTELRLCCHSSSLSHSFRIIFYSLTWIGNEWIYFVRIVMKFIAPGQDSKHAPFAIPWILSRAETTECQIC